MSAAGITTRNRDHDSHAQNSPVCWPPMRGPTPQPNCRHRPGWFPARAVDRRKAALQRPRGHGRRPRAAAGEGGHPGAPSRSSTAAPSTSPALDREREGPPRQARQPPAARARRAGVEWAPGSIGTPYFADCGCPATAHCRPWLTCPSFSSRRRMVWQSRSLVANRETGVVLGPDCMPEFAYQYASLSLRLTADRRRSAKAGWTI